MRLIAVLFLSTSAALAQPGELPFAEGQRNVLSQTMPAYPALARQAKVSGVVQFKLAIDSNGRVGNTELISGHPLLVEGALESVKIWRYRPFLLPDGTPREVTTRVGLKFDISKLTVVPVEVRGSSNAGGSGAEAPMSGSAEPYTVTAKVLNDHLQNDSLPAYPATAKAQKIAGTVRMKLTVGRTGKVIDLIVTEGPSVLRDISAESARKRSYRPFLRNGSAAAVTGDAYFTFTLNPDAQMSVFPGDEIDALLDAAMITVRDLKMDATQKYCLEAIERARAAKEDHSYTIQEALGILYELYSRAANADASKSEELYKRLVSLSAEQERPNGFWTAQSMFGLGGVHLASRRYADAGKQYSGAIALLEHCVDPPDRRFCSMLLGDALGYQGVVLYAQGKITESLPYFDRAVGRPDGAIHEETKVVALSIYAKALVQAGRGGDAKEVVKKLEEFQKTHPDAAKKAGLAR